MVIIINKHYGNLADGYYIFPEGSSIRYGWQGYRSFRFLSKQDLLTKWKGEINEWPASKFQEYQSLNQLEGITPGHVCSPYLQTKYMLHPILYFHNFLQRNQPASELYSNKEYHSGAPFVQTKHQISFSGIHLTVCFLSFFTCKTELLSVYLEVI